MSNLLIKTGEGAPTPDKNSRNYKGVTFTEVVMMNTPFGTFQKPLSQSRSNKINCYEKSYLNEKPELGYHDPIFDPKKPQNGGMFQGSIETRNVETYDITDLKGDTRSVNTFTTVVFGDTTSPAYETLVKAAFKAKGHELLEAANVIAKVPAKEAF